MERDNRVVLGDSLMFWSNKSGHSHNTSILESHFLRNGTSRQTKSPLIKMLGSTRAQHSEIFTRTTMKRWCFVVLGAGSLYHIRIVSRVS